MIVDSSKPHPEQRVILPITERAREEEMMVPEREML
jgi:hypothetical protein